MSENFKYATIREPEEILKAQHPECTPQRILARHQDIIVPPKINERKVRYYLGIAEAVAKNSTCLRRKYGAIIVKNDEVIATGYNGAPRKCINCSSTGFCMRNIIGSTKGDGYNVCMSVHAEMNAMLSAARRDMIGGTLYIVGLEAEADEPTYAKPAPCLLCHRQIINAGIVDCFGFDNGPIKDDAPFSRIDISGHNFMGQMRDNIQEVALHLPEDVAMEVMQKLVEAGLADAQEPDLMMEGENPIAAMEHAIEETAREVGLE